MKKHNRFYKDPKEAAPDAPAAGAAEAEAEATAEQRCVFVLA